MGRFLEQYHSGMARIAIGAGTRDRVWHGQGPEVALGASAETIAKAAGLDYVVAKAQAMAQIDGAAVPVPGLYFPYRRDTGATLSRVVVTDMYSIDNLQPIDFVRFSQRYAAQDQRFTFSAAGYLDNGARVWSTAAFQKDQTLTVGGQRHFAYLLLTSTYDASSKTEAALSVVNAVCDNTIEAALGSGVRVAVSHRSKFVPEVVAKQLATMAQATDQYKAIGDAMASFEMSREQVSAFLRSVFDIPADIDITTVSTRKQNQLQELHAAYKTSIAEGAPAKSAWACLQALTRYVDHDRGTRGAGDNAVAQAAARFDSAHFGTGNAIKHNGMAVLQGLLKAANKMPVLA